MSSLVLSDFGDALAGSRWFWVFVVATLGVCGVVSECSGPVLSTTRSVSCTSLAESSEPSSSRRSPCVVLAPPRPPPPAGSSSGATRTRVKLTEPSGGLARRYATRCYSLQPWTSAGRCSTLASGWRLCSLLPPGKHITWQTQSLLCYCFLLLSRCCGHFFSLHEFISFFNLN